MDMIKRVVLITASIPVMAASLVSPPCFATDEDRVGWLNNRGVALLKEGNVEEAIEKLEAARRMAPGNRTVLKNLASAYLSQAERLAAKSEVATAVRYLDEAVSLGERDETLSNNIAATYNELAGKLIKEGKYAEATSLLQTAVGLKPENMVLRSNLGMALYRDNRRAEALDEFRAVAVAEPKNALARKMCGMLYYWKGQMGDALSELKAASELAPTDKETLEVLKKVESEYIVEKDFDVDSHVNFTVSFDGDSDYRIGREVIDALQAAWSRVGSDLNFYPSEKIAVVIYTNRQFRDLLDKPKNVGGLYDGKIRVPVGGIDTERDRERLRKALAHEYAHGAVHFLTHNRCPLWFNEGIAEYMSETWTPDKQAHLLQARDSGRLFPLESLSAALRDSSSPRIRLAYIQAMSVVQFIASRYGVYNLRRILDRIDEGDDIEEALRRSINIGMKQLEEEWRKSLE